MSTPLRRVEAGESVAAVYASAVGEMPDAVFVRLGTVCLAGRPSEVVDMLGRALRECYASWGAGSQFVACDGPYVNRPSRQANALPPLVGPSEVAGPPSRSAVAPAKLLVLDGGAVISDHPASSGGGIETSVYLIRDEEGAPWPVA
jgi:hypothetical protein